MACPRCGSWSVRADRSLAGRLICGRCGNPLAGGSRQSMRTVRGRSGPHRVLGLALALIIVSAVLAALDSVSKQPSAPDAAGDRPHDRWQ